MQVQQEDGAQQQPEAVGAAAEDEEDEDMAAEPSAAPAQPAEQAKPRLQSKVAVPSPFDPRQALARLAKAAVGGRAAGACAVSPHLL